MIILDNADALWQVKRVYPTVTEYERATGDYSLTRVFGTRKVNQKVYLSDGIEEDIRGRSVPITQDSVKKVGETLSDFRQFFKHKLDLARSIVKKAQRYKFFQHETRSGYYQSIMARGLVPQFQKFRNLNVSVTFYTGFDGKLYRSSGGTGQADSIYFIFETPDDKRHVLEFLGKTGVERMDMWNIKKVEDWFVSTKTIPHAKFRFVVDNSGRTLWERGTG